MKRILFLASLFAAALSAQTPDCLPPAQLIQSGSGNVPAPNGYFDNRAIQCQTWTVAYQSDDFGGVTLEFDYAGGASAPGGWAALTPVASSASFGSPVAPFGVATFNVLSATAGSSLPAPWLRVNVTGGTGGTVRIELYGYRTGPTGGTGGGGGGSGGTGCPNPCPVEGVDASGAAPTVPPVATAGFDGTDVRTVSTDSSGRVNVNVNGTVPISGACPNPCPVSQIGLGSFTSAQQGVTASAAALGTNTAKAVCVKALIGNTINVYVGASGVTDSTGFELPPGQGVCVNLSNTNLLYVIASTTGASVSYEWTN